MRRPFLNALTGFLLWTGVCHAQNPALILNRAPADTSTLEDVPLRLFIRNVFRDSLGEPVTYSAKVDGQYGSVAVAGDSLVFTPSPDYWGTAVITLFGLAGGSRANFIAFQIAIISVNDPPYFISSVPEIAFHNNDTFSINLESRMRDVESPPTDLSLEVDSLPGFAFTIKGRTLSGRAVSTIARSIVKVRAVDPEKARSQDLGISLFPNLPADSIPLLRPAPPKDFLGLQLFAPEADRFQVLSAYSGRMMLDTYLPDGSKTEGARIDAFAPLDSASASKAYPLGPNFLVVSSAGTGADFRTGLYLTDSDFTILRSVPPHGNDYLAIKAVDTAGRRIYVQRTLQTASGSKTVFEAYDFDLNPLAAPAFAGDGSLIFHGGRTLVVKPRNDIWPLELIVDTYSPDGVKESSQELPIDHVPARDSLLPSIQSYLLVPYSAGYAAFLAVQDYRADAGGGRSYAAADYYTLYRKFGPDLKPLGPAVPMARDSQDQLSYLQVMGMGGGFLLNAVGIPWSVLRLELHQYLYAFDANMNPRGQPDLRILPANAGYSLFAPLSDRQFIEVLQASDGRRTGVVRTWDPETLPVSAGRAGGSSRFRSKAAPVSILWDADGKRAFDVLGKRRESLK